MITTINNDLRVYQVITSTGKQSFCNLHQLNEVVKNMSCNEGYFKIYHFWDNRPKVVTKKYLKQVFESHRLKQEFIY